jgi:quercetin dioxygenase-like cupin family protein
MSNSVVQVPAGTGRKFWGAGDQLRLLVTGAETGGAFFMAETIVPPGGGPPPHLHTREDESFFLQEGTLTVQVGDQMLQASPGDFVFLPRGIVHTFKNTSSSDAKMLVIGTPAGFEGFFEETFYPVVEGEAPPPPGPEIVARFLAAAPKYGLTLFPPGQSAAV